MAIAGGRILVVDDDAAICVVIAEALKRQGHSVRTASSIAAREELLLSFSPDVLVTDVMLPDGDGLDDMAAILERTPDLRAIVLSARNTLDTAVRATGQGAFEYLPKPFDLNELTRAVSEALANRRRADDASPAEPGEEERPDASLPLIGRAPQMQEVYRTIAKVVSNDLNILVLGESGTGKELVARAIHDLGRRHSYPFIAINMAAIPRELIEAELFGYEKGAFTGAIARTAGKFEQAQGGTLFLDEIGDMPIEAQTRLLRVLQSGEVTMVGGARPVHVDVRIVAATNRNLLNLIADGRFREDLYYRLNVVPIRLPALRERPDDIPLLARHFLDLAAQSGLPRKILTDEAAELLRRYDWPGNVRELENLVQRLSVLLRDSVVCAAELRPLLDLDQSAPARAVARGTSVRETVRLWAREQLAIGNDHVPGDLHGALLDLIEPALFVEVLTAVDGNQIRAAALLGLNRNTLRKKLTDYEIEPATPVLRD
jgi:two-component system, NtrC family, nitrogen regulation response regulator GlnG